MSLGPISLIRHKAETSSLSASRGWQASKHGKQQSSMITESFCLRFCGGFQKVKPLTKLNPASRPGQVQSDIPAAPRADRASGRRSGDCAVSPRRSIRALADACLPRLDAHARPSSSMTHRVYPLSAVALAFFLAGCGGGQVTTATVVRTVISQAAPAVDRQAQAVAAFQKAVLTSGVTHGPPAGTPAVCAVGSSAGAAFDCQMTWRCSYGEAGVSGSLEGAGEADGYVDPDGVAHVGRASCP